MVAPSPTEFNEKETNVSTLTFVKEIPKKAGQGRPASVWTPEFKSKLVAGLKKRPGVWALFEPPKTATGSFASIRTTLYLLKSEIPGFDASARRGELYVRFTPVRRKTARAAKRRR